MDKNGNRVKEIGGGGVDVVGEEDKEELKG